MAKWRGEFRPGPHRGDRGAVREEPHSRPGPVRPTLPGNDLLQGVLLRPQLRPLAAQERHNNGQERMIC